MQSSGPVGGEPPPPSEGPQDATGPTYAKPPKKKFDHRELGKHKPEKKTEEKKFGGKEAKHKKGIKDKPKEEKAPTGAKKRDQRLERKPVEKGIDWTIKEKGSRDERDQKGKPLKDELEVVEETAPLRGPAEQPLISTRAPKKRVGMATQMRQVTPQLAQVTAPLIVSPQVDTSSMSTGLASNIDKIVEVFQNNRFFNSSVQQIQVSTKGVETVISVSLSNGVEVQVNLAPGGQELNILIQGVTATAQAQIDNRQNQQLLMERLAERGFIVHQIQTVRGEGAPVAAPAAPAPVSPITAPAGAHEHRERGDRGGQGERGGREGGEGGEEGEGGRG